MAKTPIFTPESFKESCERRTALANKDVLTQEEVAELNILTFNIDMWEATLPESPLWESVKDEPSEPFAL